MPVNDLAIMNKLTPPFTLSVGQKIKVPAGRQSREIGSQSSATTPTTGNATSTTTVAPPPKISSDPAKPLPKITTRSSSKFSWPIRGTIVSAYGAKRNGLFNDGINIGGKVGATIAAAENGVVAYAGNEVKGMGNLIIVQHTDGWMTIYAHMDKMSVRRGARVSVGQKIGTLGQTGKVDSPQLHFEIRKGTKAYDPISQLKK
jgi:murein DD-endopeptidase MepM/ murein hydrolase activator NlpD